MQVEGSGRDTRALMEVSLECSCRSSTWVLCEERWHTSFGEFVSRPFHEPELKEAYEAHDGAKGDVGDCLGRHQLHPLQLAYGIVTSQVAIPVKGLLFWFLEM